MIAELSCGDEQVDRSSLTVADGAQLRVHTALGFDQSGDHASLLGGYAGRRVTGRTALAFAFQRVGLRMREYRFAG